MIIDQALYSGDLIHSRFAYKYFRDNVSPLGNIVAFRAPMLVDTNLIDLEDSLSEDYIFSDDALNFCWEIPNLCPLGAVAFQRLFNTKISKILAFTLNKTTSGLVHMKGDDIMVLDKWVDKDMKYQLYRKASVSITYSKDNVALGHTGINIDAGLKAPDFAYSTHIDSRNVGKFQNEVIDTFNEMLADMFVATTKISL